MPWLLAVLFLVPSDPSKLALPPFPPDPQQVWMNALHQCENHENVPKVWDTNDEWSYGKYQWQMRSWLRYEKQGATKENISDDTMQDVITRYVLNTIGDGDWYNCSKVVRKSLGAFPSS